MKLSVGFILVSGLTVVLICLANKADSSPVAGKPPAISYPSAKLRFVGAGSCAAAACHNNQGVSGAAGSEYATWVSRDRHAQAYEVLANKRSADIMKHLGRGHAQEDALCLSCHVVPGVQKNDSRAPSFFASDGVSCESCHGPAEKWVAEHYKDSWKDFLPEKKFELGMRETKALPARIQLCLDCHVGTREAEVNHDLIAAGHPRLMFEFSAFHASWNRHWPDGQDKDPGQGGRADFEARAWILGQTRTAKAALDLLEARASDDHKPWPEFTETACYACHHDLQTRSWRQQREERKDKAGSLPWSPWYFTQLQTALPAGPGRASLLDKVDGIAQKIARKSNRQDIARLAGEASAELDRLIVAQAQQKELPLQTMYEAVLAKDRGQVVREWDESSQTYLFLAALHNTWSDQKNFSESTPLRPALIDVRKMLRFPDGFDSPRSFHPEAIRRRLSQFQPSAP